MYHSYYITLVDEVSLYFAILWELCVFLINKKTKMPGELINGHFELPYFNSVWQYTVHEHKSLIIDKINN